MVRYRGANDNRPVPPGGGWHADIPGRIEDANPESRDSGFDASHRPGMTAADPNALTLR
jgi:hypothetical protein